MSDSMIDKIRYILSNAFPVWENRALKEGEGILKDVLADARGGIWEWNIRSNRLKFSRQLLSVLGYAASEAGKDISFWENLVHPDDREKAFLGIAELVRGKTRTRNYEYRILLKDGTYRWVLDMARVVFRDGSPLRLVAVQTDIHHQKLGEEAFRESEEKYRILLEESNDPIFIFNPNCTFQYVNRAFALAVEMTQEDILEQSVWHMFRKNEADLIYRTVREVVQNGLHRVIEVSVTKFDGDRFYMTSIEPVRDRSGNTVSVMCMSKDITERKKAEDELVKSRDLTTKVFMNFPVAIFMKDYNKDGRYVVGNKMWDDLQQGSPTLSRVLSGFEDAALSIGSAVIFEHRVPARDGGTKTMKSNLIPLYDQQGQLEYLLGMSEDISDLKKMEEDLAAKDAALAQASTEKAISALVAGLSHDINNALGGITGGEDLTRMHLARIEKSLFRIDTLRSELTRMLQGIRAEGKLDPMHNIGVVQPLEGFLEQKLPRELVELKTSMEAARKYLTYVNNGTLMIRDVTSGIRDYVKHDSSLGSFEMRPAIRGAVSLSKGQYKPMAQDQGKTVTVEICDTSPAATVFGNAGEFMGVVVNLINNAVAEFPRGGSNSICISWEQDVNREREDIVRIRVSNDGPPILEHVLGRLFSEKVGSTHGGSGIGLMAVKSTLNRFGARIRHCADFLPLEKNGQPASQEKRGMKWTTFEMELLMSDALTETERTLREPDVSRRLLVVDDEKFMLDIMEKYAENLGHSAVIFNNPKEALEWFEAHGNDVDVVISDQCMPQMNGCEMISGMKRCKPDKTFMIMTGHGTMTLSREDTRDVHLLVRKPFDQKQLSFAIEDAVEASRRPATRTARRPADARFPASV